MSIQSRENEEKIAYFQDVTGVEDSSLSTQILHAHGWDMDAAVTSMVGGTPSFAGDRNPSSTSPASVDRTSNGERWGGNETSSNRRNSERLVSSPRQVYPATASRDRYNRVWEDDADRGAVPQDPQGPGVVWRLVNVPFSMIRGSYNIMYGAVGLGIWVAGGVISYGLGALGLAGPGDRRETSALLPPPTGATEASIFLRNFEREYGERHPAFQTSSFMEALRRSGQHYKFLFVYLHSPEHANTPSFCQNTLCAEAVVQFINENFVVWGGNVRSSEGFQMSNSLKASTFPFCAVVTATSNQRIALLRQVEGPRSANDLVVILQRVVEEQGAVLVAQRVEQEEQLLNRRLREEQDAAYQLALQADQELERRRQAEAERVAQEAAAAERKKIEEEEAAARKAQEAAERESSLDRCRQEKAMSLGLEPEKGPDVTQVLLRLPNGERKERRFFSTVSVQKVYDYVDSLGSMDSVNYSLVSNFPRTVYGSEKLVLSLKDAGLHPHASLFVQVEDN